MPQKLRIKYLNLEIDFSYLGRFIKTYYFHFLQNYLDSSNDNEWIHSYNFIIKMLAPKDEEIEALLAQNTFKAPNLLCTSGNIIQRFCTNQDCKYDSLCCDEDSCKSCEFLHQLCSFIKLRQFNKVVQEKVFIHNEFMRKLFTIQDQLINKMISHRKDIVQKSKVWRFGNSEIIDSLYFQNIRKGFKGKQMKKLFIQVSQLTNQEKQANQYLGIYKKEGEKMIQEMKKAIVNIIQSLNKRKNMLSENKKIEKGIQNIKIKEVKQVKKMKKMEIQKNEQIIVSRILLKDKQGQDKYKSLLKQLNYPSSVKLIFRASQHNFSAKKFHQSCDGISDTVTIVSTEFGRKIAAYTPLKWSSAQGWVADDSRRSFLYQLDLRQKMSLIQPQYAICNYYNYGPIFGGGNDLCIVDKCNQHQYSLSNPSSYNIDGKYKQDQKSWTAFSGNQNGYVFRVLEYQVLQVKW